MIRALTGSLLLHALVLGSAALLGWAGTAGREVRDSGQARATRPGSSSGGAVTIVPVTLLAGAGSASPGERKPTPPDPRRDPAPAPSPGSDDTPAAASSRAGASLPQTSAHGESESELGDDAVVQASAEGTGSPEGADREGEGGIEGSHGLAAAEVVPPTPLHVAVPAAPQLPPGAALEARVRLRIHVSATGEVTDVGIAAGSGSLDLDAAAVRAGWRLRYAPGLANGIPIDMWTEAEILF